jgi:hypothetical protein
MRGTLAKRGAEMLAQPATKVPWHDPQGIVDRAQRWQSGSFHRRRPGGSITDALASRVVGLSGTVRFKRFRAEKRSVEGTAYPKIARSPAPSKGSMPAGRRIPPVESNGVLSGVWHGGGKRLFFKYSLVFRK